MTFSVEIFQPIFNLAMLIFSLDIALSGLLVLTSRQDMLVRPKLLGLVIMRRMRSSGDKMRGRNSVLDMLFNTRVMAAYFLLDGLILIFLTISTLIQILG